MSYHCLPSTILLHPFLKLFNAQKWLTITLRCFLAYIEYTMAWRLIMSYSCLALAHRACCWLASVTSAADLKESFAFLKVYLQHQHGQRDATAKPTVSTSVVEVLWLHFGSS